jgi:hypothetical protein
MTTDEVLAALDMWFQLDDQAHEMAAAIDGGAGDVPRARREEAADIFRRVADAAARVAELVATH